MRSKILDLLRQAGDGYVSGEEMAERLGVTRTAVWKHIQELRNSGYEILSHSRNGYSLRESPDSMLASEISHRLGTEIVGRRILSFGEVDSTNNVAKKLIIKKGPEGNWEDMDGLLVVAESQTGGRGRLERSFFSPAGKGIWFSLVLAPPFAPQEAPKCTLMAAVAVTEAMWEFGLKPGIKWPNDIVFGGRKLVGILTEASCDIDRIKHIVLGIGINANMEIRDFPKEIQQTATSMSIIKGEEIPRVKFLQAVLRSLERWYKVAMKEGFGPVFEAWRKYSVTIGQEVRVVGVRGGEDFTGRAMDIDSYGALLVETDEGIRTVMAGDVSIRPRS